MRVILVAIFTGTTLLSFTDGPAIAQNNLAGGPKPSASSVLLDRGDESTIVTTVPADPKKGQPVAFRLYKSNGQVSTRIFNKIDVAECTGALGPGDVCKSSSDTGTLRLVYRLAEAPEKNKAVKYDVALDLTDTSRGEIGQLINVSEAFKEMQGDVQKYYSSEIFTPHVKGNPNGEIRLVIEANNPAASNNSDEYIRERIGSIYDWLEPRLPDPTAVTVRIEPLDRAIPNNQPLKYKVSGIRILPGGRNEAIENGKVEIVIVTDHNFPSGKYSIEVAFVGNPPRELAKPFSNDLAGVSAKPPDASKNDMTLGLREFKNNLDLGLAFTSSVSDVKVGSKSQRLRQSNGILDLRFAPWLKKSLDDHEVFLFTPFFIDAKVSTGSIDAKTLSLNRIYLGTQLTARYINDTWQNKHLFTFRGVNASDRDFKRSEAKFEFEYRPLFSHLNQPLLSHYAKPGPERVLVPKGLPNPKQVIDGWFGYQIQPFVGVELGDVYRAARNALNIEEQSRFVRRLDLGMDIVLNLSRFVNLRISDTAYLRGEVSSGSRRNYFSGEIDAPIVTSGDTLQCLFVSYERGDQPPFGTPGVNSFKIGYRITSNFFHLIPKPN